jgi:hypothetical protein
MRGPWRIGRLVLVVALAVGGGAGLAGCRTAPGAAAYIGGQQVSVARVQGVVREVNGVADQRVAARIQARDQQQAAIADGVAPDELPEPPAEARLPIVRTSGTEVLSLIVWGEVGQRVVDEHRIEEPAVPADVFAAKFALPADSEYVRLWARYWSVLSALARGGQARPLSEDEAGRYFHAVDDAGLVPAGADADEYIAQLRTKVNLAPLFEAQEVLSKQQVTVNPQFAPLVLPVVLLPDGPMFDVAFPDEGGVPVEEA